MAIQLIPNLGAQAIGAAVQTMLATSKIRIFSTGFTPSITDTEATLAAVETDFSGYPSGGYAVTAFLAPYYPPTGGVQVTSPQIDAVFTPPESGEPVTDTVGGWFLVDTGGVLIAEGLFDAPVAMAGVGDGFPLTVALNFATLSSLITSWLYGSQQ